jgi:hypothetical protein
VDRQRAAEQGHARREGESQELGAEHGKGVLGTGR